MMSAYSGLITHTTIRTMLLVCVLASILIDFGTGPILTGFDMGASIPPDTVASIAVAFTDTAVSTGMAASRGIASQAADSGLADFEADTDSSGVADFGLADFEGAADSDMGADSAVQISA